jgi:hypothetical protein
MEPVVEDRRRKLTADDVSRMLADGILGEDDRVELIEGELLIKPPQDPPHASGWPRAGDVNPSCRHLRGGGRLGAGGVAEHGQRDERASVQRALGDAVRRVFHAGLLRLAWRRGDLRAVRSRLAVVRPGHCRRLVARQLGCDTAHTERA